MAQSFEIFVEDPTTLVSISSYDAIKIYRADSQEGDYTALTPTIALSVTQYLYICRDGSGDPTKWYKYTFLSTNDSQESAAVGPFLGGRRWYITATALKARVGEINPGNDIQFAKSAEAATNFVQEYCRRSFSQTTELRYFEGKGQVRALRTMKQSPTLWIDDVVSLSEIILDYSGGVGGGTLTTLTLGEHCYLWPQNAPPQDRPYSGLSWIQGAALNFSGAGYYFEQGPGEYWPRGYRAVRLTGTWGWPLDRITQSPVPWSVQEATMELAARIYKGRDTAYSKVTGLGELGTLQVMNDFLSKDTAALLEKFVRNNNL